MSGLFRLNSIEVQYSKIGGRGVFAKKPIKKGSIIEEAPFLPVYKEEIGTKMMDYVFDLDEHCYAVCFGYGSLYNHAKRNNCQYEINLKKDRKKLIKSIDKEMQKTGLLSYLLFENDEIVIDKKSPDNRLGLLFNDRTKWTTASIGKSFTSYVVGQAICDGYIENVDVKLNDWPIIKNTLYHMEGHFRGSKPSKKKKYNYGNIVSNIIINYIWFKSNGDFQKITDKVFKENARIEDSIYFLKISDRTTQGMKNGIRYKYLVNDEDGPLRYSMELNRYDFLRIAKAMMDDWKNDTCEGKYLKTLQIQSL